MYFCFCFCMGAFVPDSWLLGERPLENLSPLRCMQFSGIFVLTSVLFCRGSHFLFCWFRLSFYHVIFGISRYKYMFPGYAVLHVSGSMSPVSR